MTKSDLTIFLTMTLAISTFVASAPGAASAQERIKPGEPDQETTVKVQRIRPEDLPKEEESHFPSVLRQTDALPRPSSLDELRKGALEVAPRVVEVVILQIPKPPMRATPMMTTGHAVWISAEEGAKRPVLVTPHSWLADADSIWVAPARDKRAGGIPGVRTAKLSEISDSRAAEKFVKKAEADGWIKARISQADKHRNLTTLVADRGFELISPKAGIQLFDTTSKPTTRVFGYSPSMGSALVSTQYVEPTGELALSYYLQSTFPAILGAPIVTDAGEIVGLTVFRHPDEPGRTLVVPPLALRQFVTTVQGLSDGGGPKIEEIKEDEPKGKGRR